MLRPVHFSNLKRMALSPAHYLASVEQPFSPTPSMRFGSLVHHVYAGEGVIVFEGDRRGKKWEEFAELHPGEEIFTSKEFDRARRCADSILKTPHAVEVLMGSMERTIEWEWLGRSCSSRPDVAGVDFVTDLKTTNCAEPFHFRRAALGRFAYHAQLAFYRLAIGYRRPVPPEFAYIVAVETAAPFDVTVLRLTPRALLEGEKLCRVWFERMLGCEASNAWPGYSQSILDADIDEDTELTIDGESFAEEAA